MWIEMPKKKMSEEEEKTQAQKEATLNIQKLVIKRREKTYRWYSL